MPWKPPTHHTLLGRSARDQRYDASRQDRIATQIRNSARWQQLRALVLNRQPLCVDPILLHPGRAVPATQVDHITPIAARPDLAFVLENLQPLCTSCHAQKTAMERRRARMAG